MKLFALRATTDVIAADQHVGYLALDATSGGYPWNKGEHPEFFQTDREINNELKDILRTDRPPLSEYTNGGMYVTTTTSVFLEEFRKVTGKGRDTAFRLTFEALEFDFSDPKNVKTTVLRKVEVSGKEAEDYKTREQAYYQAKELDLD